MAHLGSAAKRIELARQRFRAHRSGQDSPASLPGLAAKYSGPLAATPHFARIITIAGRGWGCAQCIYGRCPNYSFKGNATACHFLFGHPAARPLNSGVRPGFSLRSQRTQRASRNASSPHIIASGHTVPGKVLRPWFQGAPVLAQASQLPRTRFYCILTIAGRRQGMRAMHLWSLP